MIVNMHVTISHDHPYRGKNYAPFEIVDSWETRAQVKLRCPVCGVEVTMEVCPGGINKEDFE